MPECEERCQCNEGYYRNDDGACVLASECPHECGQNEIWTDCSTCSGRITISILSQFINYRAFM